MRKKWLLPLLSLTLALTTVGAAFALTSGGGSDSADGTDTAGEVTHGDPTYEQWLSNYRPNQGPVTSIDDIDPNVCNTVHNINACTPEELEEALGGIALPGGDPDVADEWKLVEASRGPGGFSLRLPQGWHLNELQGIDSYVGEIIWGDGRLTYDYGWYSSSLAEVDDDDPQYIVTYEEIGGRRAKLVQPRAEGDGLFTGVYFEDFDGGNLDIPSQNRLQITGVRLTPDQQEAAFAVIWTIRPLASESRGEPDPNQLDGPVNGICCKPLVEGEPDPNQHDGPVNDPAVAREPGPGIAVGEPYPLPTDKACGPGATVPITSDGQFSCRYFDTGTVDDGPGGPSTGRRSPSPAWRTST